MSKLASGVALSYLLIVVRLVITLAFTPFLISGLGTEGYGLFALVGAIAAYLYIIDFGMNDSVLRFFVAHEKEPELRDGFLGRMLGLYSLLGLLVLVVTFVLASLADNIFGAQNTPAQIEMLRQMLLMTGVGAAVLIALNPVGALLSATESFVFLRGLEIAMVVLSTLGMVAVLWAGLGPVEIVMVTAGTLAVQSVSKLIYAMVRLGVRVRLNWPDRAELQKVGGYAAPIFFSMIAEAVFWRFDSILIAAFLGVGPVAVYAIGVTFNKYFMSFAVAISRVLTPEIVRQIDAGAEAQAITKLMIRISRVQALVLFVVLGGLVVFGHRFLILWLGDEFSISYWIMISVLIPYSLELTGNARNIVLQVKGLYWYKSAITLGMALLNVPLTIVLLNTLGVVGASISTGVAVFAGYLMIAVLLQRRAGVRMLEYWRETARGILPVFLVLTVAGLLSEPYWPSGWAGLGMGVVAYSALYVAAMAFFAVTAEEKALFQKAVARVWRRAPKR